MRFPIVLLTATLAAVGCSSKASNQPSTSPSSGAVSRSAALSSAAVASARPTPTKTAAIGTTITTGSSQFGDILFDARGQAIYLFDAEKSKSAQCYDDCAAAWPPVLTTGRPRASGGVLNVRLGTTTRRDGSIQVTYNGHPLYFYAHEGPRQVTCHNVREFGGLWLVLDATGNAKT